MCERLKPVKNHDIQPWLGQTREENQEHLKDVDGTGTAA